MPNEVWGKQITAAMKAVRQMHADSSRLLLDLDRVMPGYKAVYGSVVTMDLSYDIKRGVYMSEGLLRHWVRSSEPNAVIAVNLAFWDENEKLKEPLFIAAKLIYAEPLGTVPDRNKAWDPWYAYLEWTRDAKLHTILRGRPPAKRTDLSQFAVFATPLASVTSEDRAGEFLRCVLNA